MLTGKVRWFSNSHGYGFIQDKDGKDVFVHYTVISKAGFRSLMEDQTVGYEVGVGPKGNHATFVIPFDQQESDRDHPGANGDIQDGASC